MNNDIANKTFVIYKITNNLNDKIYIGKTIQKLSTRIYQHVWDSKSNKDNSNNKFHNAIRKYGENNFTVTIIDGALSDSELKEKEKFWIKSYDSTVNGYNTTFGGDGVTNTKGIKKSETHKQHLRDSFNEEHREYLRNSRIMFNKKHSGGMSQRAIKVVKLDLPTGDVISIYDCIRDASKDIGKNIHSIETCISQCCKHEIKQSYGYGWMYYDEYISQQNKEDINEKGA